MAGTVGASVEQLEAALKVTWPFAAKAIGESSNILTAAAIANAVFDACGVRVTDLPIRPRRCSSGCAMTVCNRLG
jgi:CO/xanthine dehydrogenase Mo-binding subunit